MRRFLAVLLVLLWAPILQGQDWICYPGQVTEVATGITTNVGGVAGELKFAIENSDTAGAVIECNGVLSGVTIAVDNTPGMYDVYRADPIRVTLVPGPDHESIGPVSYGGKKQAGGLPGLAVEYLSLDGVTVDGRFAQSPLAGYFNTSYGDIVYNNMTLLSTKATTKWGSRIMGRARSIVITGCVFNGGGQEHACYIDHPLEGIRFENNIGMNWRRTLLQVVTREEQYGGNGSPVATGDLFILNNVAENCGQDGAWNFTVAGWPKGTVHVVGNRVNSIYNTGLFISYYDFKQGTLVSSTGHQARHVIWRDNGSVLSKAERHNNAFGDIGLLEINGGALPKLYAFGPKAAFELDHNGQTCGSIEIHARGVLNGGPNAWNLQCGQGPFRLGGQNLTPAQVDAYWVEKPTEQ